MDLDRYVMVRAVAWYLALVQIIHFFQRKDLRLYSALLRFSLLQVVVAAVLTQGSLFGLMLVAYLFAALWALLAFFLYGERLRVQQGEARAAARPQPAAAARWPLLFQAPTFSSPAVGRIALGWESCIRVLWMGLATLALTALVFFTVPRFGQGAWRGMRHGLRSSVGFSDTVRLGDLGLVLQNPQQVLQLSLYEDASGEPFQVEQDLYVRGALLTHYQDRQWTLALRREVSLGRLERLLRASLAGPLVRQKIVIEPMDGDDLFCLWPFLPVDQDSRLVFDPRKERLSRPPELAGHRFLYELATTAFEDSAQAAVVPALESADLSGLLQVPQENGRSTVPSLEALAAQWLAESGLPPENVAARARFLERNLRDSGRFQYSLEGQGRDPEIDPVEDFIAHHPRGHCEFFATALALMLRSQGIPARVVVGFRSGEWNDVGDRFLQVRQLHAHTWVEAHLAASQIPSEVKDRDSPRWRAGGWLRLDATPAASETDAAGSFWLRGPGKYLNWLDFAWSNYVMEMDRPRQRRAVYYPVVDKLRRALAAVADPRWWRDVLGGLGRALGLDRLHQPGGSWFNWRAFLLVLIAGAVLVAVALAAKRRLRPPWLAWRRSRNDVARGPDRVNVDFYRRLEAVLGRHGLVRPPARTQREFALAAGRHLADQLADEQLAPLPVLLADAFYQVRFGATALDKSQGDAVELALATLERAVARPAKSAAG
jgi:transglutaminase-like putative cysteine protease